MTMVITIPAHKEMRSGPRPINLNHDVPQVMALLRTAFGSAFDSEGQRALEEYTSAAFTPAFLWRFNPAASRLSHGYVWEENGRIVGNATILTTRSHGRYLVVNVAVHPDFRRRGIARNLMNRVTDHVQQRGGHEILLQVDHDNDTAIHLYQTLNFRTLGAMTTWAATAGRIHGLDSNDEIPLRELRRSEWQEAYQIDCLALPPDLHWPEPLPPDAYRGGFWRQLVNITNGRSHETWVAANGRSLVGLAAIWSEWGRAHYLTLRVHPQWAGQLERPLLAKILRRLPYLPRRSARIEHPAQDALTNQLLREANFKARRTLTHMRLDLPQPQSRPTGRR